MISRQTLLGSDSLCHTRLNYYNTTVHLKEIKKQYYKFSPFRGAKSHKTKIQLCPKIQGNNLVNSVSCRNEIEL